MPRRMERHEAGLVQTHLSIVCLRFGTIMVLLSVMAKYMCLEAKVLQVLFTTVLQEPRTVTILLHAAPYFLNPIPGPRERVQNCYTLRFPPQGPASAHEHEPRAFARIWRGFPRRFGRSRLQTHPSREPPPCPANLPRRATKAAAHALKVGPHASRTSLHRGSSRTRSPARAPARAPQRPSCGTCTGSTR